ncbi:MAG: MBL fold metallo-hydrolase [Candidatus Nezhaarchaeales archaeon]
MFIAKTPMIWPPRQVNTYIVKGANESLIIDAGPNLLLSQAVLYRNLRRINVDLKRSMFLATHLHVDHFGLIERLADGSKIYVGHREVEHLFEEERVRDVLVFAIENGFPESRAALITRFMSKRHVKKSLKLIPLRDGDVIEVDDYRFKCIETPGHTCGHICLYDQEKRMFISGDHILKDITPNISSWSYEEDVLSTYLHSLKRTYEIDAHLVLPGHGSTFIGLRKRVLELINHYKCRLLEILNVIGHRSCNAYWITTKIKWDKQPSFWNHVLNLQEWLAFGETLACLNFLVKLGVVERRMLRNKAFYNIVDINAFEELNNFFSRLYSMLTPQGVNKSSCSTS